MLNTLGDETVEERSDIVATDKSRPSGQHLGGGEKPMSVAVNIQHFINAQQYSAFQKRILA
jgi:hypothetical protein